MALIVNLPLGRGRSLWTDGELSLLAAARFDLSDEADWRISTVDEHVDLRFTALGERREDIRAVVIESVFRQRYGTFAGRVGDRRVQDAFGLVEDHRSVW